MDFVRNQRGLTLVETIVSLVLILILVTVFTGAITTSLQREVEVDNSLKAVDLAAGIIEFLGEDDENRGIVRDLADNGNISLEDFIEDEEFEVDMDFKDLKIEKSEIFVKPDYDGNSDLYEVKVEIYWHEPGVDNRSESLTSLIFAQENDNGED